MELNIVFTLNRQQVTNTNILFNKKKNRCEIEVLSPVL